jgi:hypothetical protein
MQAQQEKKATSSETQKEMLERLDNLASKNRAAYKNALEDFRDSFTLNHEMSFTSVE